MTQKAYMDIVVVGGANYDYLIRGPRLPQPGDTIPGETFQEAPGGKGANQAVAAVRLGARAALVARIGDDGRGSAILTRLVAEGVDTSYVVRDGATPSGIALVQVEADGQKQILAIPGANSRLQVVDVHRAKDALRQARVVLVQLETPLECVVTALEFGRAGGAQTVLDPAPAMPLPEEVLRLVDVIKPSAGEAEVLTGVKVQDRASARMAAERLLRRGVGAVAMQAGDEGNLLVWPEGEQWREQWLPKLPVESIDATGAGDAFAAALAVELAKGRSLGEAGPIANAAAALTTTTIGAQAALPRRDAVLALLAQTGTQDQHDLAREHGRR